MSNYRKLLEETIGNALKGKGHVSTRKLFDGLDWKVAGKRPRGYVHSIYQLLNHLSFWQD